jgi:hypothetical protein
MRLIILLIILTHHSCSESPKQSKNKVLQTDNSLKPYQQYCLDILKRVTANDVGYPVSDSFCLWADGYVNDGWKSFYVTRTIYDGSYTYLFWKKEKDSFSLYNEAQEPKVGFERDTLFDANGDGYKDLLIINNSMNGQCQPQFSILYCFDINKGEFVKIKEVSNLPNPTFNPKEKIITGEWECQMTKDVYKVRWVDDFKLDTIYYKTLKL